VEPFISNLRQAARNTRKVSRSVILTVILVILIVLTVSYYLNTPGRLISEGIKYRKEMRCEKAINSFKQALSFNMKSAHALSLLGEEYLCAGDFTRGKFYLSKAVEFKDADGRTYYYMGALHACQGDEVNASRILKECELKETGQDMGYFSLLRLQANVMFPSYQKFALTPEEERKLLSSSFKSSDTLFFKVHRGLYYFYKGRFDEGRKIFEELVSSYPDDPSLCAYYAINLAACGRRDEALMKLKTAARENDKSPVAQQYLGALYLEAGLLDEALKALQAARAMSPGSSGPYYYLGLLHMKEGSLNEARGYLEESLLKQPNNGMAHKKLGELYDRLRMKKKAQEEYEKAITQGGPLYIVTPPY